MRLRCNKCGKVMDVFDARSQFEIVKDMGYGTVYDGSRLNLHICCNCMEDYIRSCKINPVIEEVQPENEDYEQLKFWGNE